MQIRFERSFDPSTSLCGTLWPDFSVSSYDPSLSQSKGFAGNKDLVVQLKFDVRLRFILGDLLEAYMLFTYSNGSFTRDHM